MAKKVNVPDGYKTEKGNAIPAGQYEAVDLGDGKVGLQNGKQVFTLAEDTASSVRHLLGATQSVKPEPITEADITTMINAAWKIDKKNNGDVNLDLMLNNVDGDIGERFDAHGIAKVSYTYQLRSLIGLLDNGIDTTRDFHSAPLALSRKNQGAGAGLGVAGGANDTGSFVVMGDIDTPLLKGGIKYVIVNDAYYDAIPRLQRAYPQITFIRANRANQELTRLVEIHDRQEASK